LEYIDFDFFIFCNFGGTLLQLIVLENVTKLGINLIGVCVLLFSNKKITVDFFCEENYIVFFFLFLFLFLSK